MDHRFLLTSFWMSGKLSNALSKFVTHWLPTLVFRWLLLDGLRISCPVVMSITVGPSRHHTSLYVLSCALFKCFHWEPCEFHTVLLFLFFCCVRGDNRDLAWWNRPLPLKSNSATTQAESFKHCHCLSVLIIKIAFICTNNSVLYLPNRCTEQALKWQDKLPCFVPYVCVLSIP